MSSSRADFFRGGSGKAYRRASTAQRRAAFKRTQARMLRGMAAAVSGPPRAIEYVPVKSDGEIKGVDVLIEDNDILAAIGANNTNVWLLNGVQTGSGFFNRVGKKIKLKSVRVKGNFAATYIPDAVSGRVNSTVARMLVVYDEDGPFAALPTMDQILLSTDQTGASNSTSMMAQANFVNMERFTILRDKMIDLNPGTVGYALPTATGEGQITVTCPVDEYIKLKGRDTVFSSTSNPVTIADISKGALYVLFLISYRAAGETVAAFNGYTRVRYFD